METFKKVMRGVGKFLKKLKVPIILLVIAFIVITFVKYTSNSAKKLMDEMASADQELGTVESRNLVETITATGIVESAKKRTVASTIIKDTKITSVNCEVGDYVTEGDILVTFSDETINKTISQLREDIAESKATEAVNDTANTRTYYYSYGTESITLRDLQLDIEQKQKELNEACSAYGDAKRKLEEYKNMRDDPDPEHPQDYDALIQTQENAVANAKKAEENAQLAYDKAVRALEDEVYKGSNTLAGATETYQKNEITSNDSTKKLERQLEEQRDRLDDYVITAPISGMVTQVDVEENNSFAGGNLVTIQDCSTLYVSTEIDEYDIPSIAIGQKVMFKTDATRDDELEGVIDEIAVSATSSSASNTASNSTYKVKIRVLTEDDRLKLGMTAKLSIIVKEVSNVLTVPYDAVVDKGDGEYVVYAVDEATVRKIEQRKENGKQIEGKISDMSKGDTAGIRDMENPAGADDPSEGPGGPPPEGPVIIEEEKKIEAETEAERPKSIKDIFRTAYGKQDDEGDIIADNQVEIPVEIGIESDYYTEVRSQRLKEGMTVVIKSEVEATNPFEIMMGL